MEAPILPVHIVSRSYHDPRFDEPTVNRCRVYEPDPQKAVAMIQAMTAPFEKVELAWSEWVPEEEHQAIRTLGYFRP
jgi:hypothetical protein